MPDYGDVCERLDRIYEAIIQPKRADFGAELANQSGGPSVPPGRGFRIDPAARLAYWNEQRLPINSHADFAVLNCLIEEVGGLVNYGVLERAINPAVYSNSSCQAVTKVAPQDVKDAIQHIRAALREVSCTTTIENARGTGYRLVSPDA